MTDISIRRSVSMYLCCLAFICLWHTGCGGGGGGSGPDTENPGGGDLNVQLSWQTTGAGSTKQPAPANLDACTDFRITGIYLRVKDADGNIINKSEMIPCSDRSAQLGNLGAQSGCTVEVEGYVSDQILWFGSKGEVSIGGEQSIEPIVIEMNYIGVHSAPPSATISPENTTTNVPTDTVISIRFAKAVVPSSLNTSSIRVNNADNGESVTGTIAYNAETMEALFSPAQELAVSTRYTVTVTIDVLDSNGQRIPEPLTSQFSTPTVWLVDPASAASGPGKSWKEAFHTIAEAVAAAGHGDQIWVKHGVYKPADQIAIDKPVELLGGFDGTETQHNQRDPSAWETVVDGQGEHRCFYLSSDAVVDGFTITGGSLQNESTPNGGAMYIDGGAPRIANCIFIGNTVSGIDHASGGAIFNERGSPTISGCSFINNRVSGPHSSGGAIRNYFAKDLTTITDCLFDGNTSSSERGSSGGAIENSRSDILIAGCHFANNSCIGELVLGGAICSSECNIIDIRNSSFNANRISGSQESSNGGGAIANFGDNGLKKLPSSKLSITNCTFAYNEAVVDDNFSGDDIRGGAITSIWNSNTTIVNSILWWNQAKIGTHIYHDDSSSSSIAYTNIDQPIYDESNMRQNPRFAADLHLRSTSPCIDKADGNTVTPVDVDGEFRLQGTMVDVGADEFIDSDSDRMPDYWEVSHNVSIADNDEDGDQVPNLSEYHLGTNPNVIQPVINTALRGAVRENGFHQVSDASTPTGISGGQQSYRSFFVFDVADVPPIKTAAVRMELVDYSSGSVSVRTILRSVGTPFATLSSDSSGQTGINIYNDLGTGTIYGQYESNPAEKGTVLDIQLNRAAVDAINAARSGSGLFSLGLSLLSHVKDGYVSFSHANENRTHQLVLIPE